MDEWINVGFPNEGEMPINLRLLYNWDMTDIKLIGDTVFFRSDGNTFSIRLVDFKIHFKKKYDEFLC